MSGNQQKGPGPGLPWMPWYVRDFMASTRTWPLIARCVYRELLDAAWEGNGLPPEQEQLRVMVGATPSQWRQAWPLVESKFQRGDDGRLYNLRLEKVRADSLTKYAIRAEKAVRAANARWEKDRAAAGGSGGQS